MRNPIGWLIGAGVAALIIVIGMLMIVERVPEGQTAVVYTPANGADRTLDPGWHFIWPLEKTQEYPTRITILSEDLTVTTSDGKKITMPVKYEMKVDKGKVLDIFKELGSQEIEQIQEGYLYQKLFKTARGAVSKYSVIDIYGMKTSEASAEVTEGFAKSVAPLGFIITDVTLGTPELDEATQAAIDERVKAAQELEKLTLEKQIAEQIAEKQKIEATGVAEAEIEKARGQAESNRLLQKSITPELIQLREAEARLKHGWIEVMTGEAIVDTKK